jgi:transcription elongation factor Elf1
LYFRCAREYERKRQTQTRARVVPPHFRCPLCHDCVVVAASEGGGRCGLYIITFKFCVSRFFEGYFDAGDECERICEEP